MLSQMRFGLRVDEQFAEAADVPLDEVGVQSCVLRHSTKESQLRSAGRGRACRVTHRVALLQNRDLEEPVGGVRVDLGHLGEQVARFEQDGLLWVGEELCERSSRGATSACAARERQRRTRS